MDGNNTLSQNCPVCGQPLADDMNFCVYCGGEIKRIDGPPPVISPPSGGFAWPTNNPTPEPSGGNVDWLPADPIPIPLGSGFDQPQTDHQPEPQVTRKPSGTGRRPIPFLTGKEKPKPPEPPLEEKFPEPEPELPKPEPGFPSPDPVGGGGSPFQTVGDSPGKPDDQGEPFKPFGPVAQEVEDEEELSVFAEGLPEWNLEPPNSVVVRRKRKK